MPSRFRGTTSQRGYGRGHRALKKHLEPVVAAGLARCWRCGEPIDKDEPWDLGHDDHDRSRYRGPEHRACNRATNGVRVKSQRW